MCTRREREAPQGHLPGLELRGEREQQELLVLQEVMGSLVQLVHPVQQDPQDHLVLGEEG